MAFKIMGLIFIFLVCSAAGILKSMSLSKRVKELESFCGAFSQISTEIRYFATPTDVIIKKLDEMKDFKNLKIFGICLEKMKTCDDFKMAWNSAVDQSAQQLSLTKDDIGVIKRFGETFGTTDVEGQIANCEEYNALLSKRLESARKDQTSRGKMFSSLGILAGIFFTLFFI